MLLIEMKMTADPSVVAELKAANDTVTEWATVEIAVNGTPVERASYNLDMVLGVLTDAVVTGFVTPDEGVQKFRQLTEQGEMVLSHLDALGSADDSDYVKLMLTVGNLTETGKNMTDADRAEHIANMMIGKMFGGLDIIDLTDENGEGS